MRLSDFKGAKRQDMVDWREPVRVRFVQEQGTKSFLWLEQLDKAHSFAGFVPFPSRTVLVEFEHEVR